MVIFGELVVKDSGNCIPILERLANLTPLPGPYALTVIPDCLKDDANSSVAPSLDDMGLVK